MARRDDTTREIKRILNLRGTACSETSLGAPQSSSGSARPEISPRTGLFAPMSLNTKTMLENGNPRASDGVFIDFHLMALI